MTLLGSSTKGANTLSTSNFWYALLSRLETDGNGGTTGQIHCWCKNTDSVAHSIKMNIYSDSSSVPNATLVADVSYSVPGGFDGQIDITFVATLSPNTYYWVAWVPDQASATQYLYLYYDTTGGTATGVSMASFQLTTPWPGGGANWNPYRWSIWADYSSGGGAKKIPYWHLFGGKVK
jgi:hypothetical protein